MMKNKVLYGVLGLMLLVMMSACGKKDPVADPILNPKTVLQDPFVESINFSIISGYNVFYTFSLDGAASEPNCSDNGVNYTGPFLIGGPDETVSIKAIACEGEESSEVVSGTYVFGSDS
ncbi:MAG TPA: FN3 associated domain-containing protein [Oligoflexia bacterium]|nr:FN3 associated domain-containing protein [Oligoflexia bacterium]HMR25544.1 FN3 associated domain-containing protein [Oligoflexia bacterium]